MKVLRVKLDEAGWATVEAIAASLQHPNGVPLNLSDAVRVAIRDKAKSLGVRGGRRKAKAQVVKMGARDSAGRVNRSVV
jgi:hypothetical protein